MSKHLTAERLRYLLNYDPVSGEFSWRNPPRTKSQFHGEIAGYLDKSTGYLRISIAGKEYRAHRLAWLYMTGEWPADQIDHINRIRSDNRWSNLRAATPQQNTANSFRVDNTSGKKGVTWNKQAGKRQAQICVNGKNYHLGRYNDIEDAAVAYSNIAKILHGEFAHLEEL